MRRVTEILKTARRWNELTQILDSSPKYWRAFGSHHLVNCNQSILARYEMTFVSQKFNQSARFSPSKQIIEEWQLKSEATIDNLLKILKDIYCEEAHITVAAWLQEDPDTTEKTLSQPAIDTPVNSNDYQISASLNNMTTWKHIRLFLVGDSGAGKTSVVRWLKGDPFISEHNSTDSVDVTTADINSWKSVTFDIKDYMAQLLQEEKKAVKSSVITHIDSNNNNARVPMDNNVSATQILAIKKSSTNTPTAPARSQELLLPPTLSSEIRSRIRRTHELSQAFHVWDFAGQEEYYNTHHFFLSDNAAIYLLVVDISKPIDMNKVQFWMDSIQYYGKDAPVMIIGTHRDCISSDQITVATEYLKNFSNDIWIVSCKEDKPSETRKLLMELAKNDSLKKYCKLKTMLFYDSLMEYQNSTASNSNQNTLQVITFAQAKSIASSYQLSDEELKESLKFYHQSGFILYYEELDHIFTKPQQLIDVFRTIITALELKQKLTAKEFNHLQEQGRIRSSVLERLWKGYPKILHKEFGQLLQKFGLAFADPAQVSQNYTEPDIIVPCLVKAAEEKFKLEFSALCIECILETVPPLGFSSRLISRVLDLTSIDGVSWCQIFQGGCVFTQNGIQFMIKTFPGQVLVQVASRASRKDLIPTIQQLLEIIYVTAKSHLETVSISTSTKCFSCGVKDATAEDLQRNRVQKNMFASGHFYCYGCRGRQQPYKADLPSVGQIEFDGKMIQSRFTEIFTLESQWHDLCQVLNIAKIGGWRDLGNALGRSASDLDAIDTDAVYQRSTPARLLLQGWQHETDATMRVLVNALRAINNETALLVIAGFTTQGQNTSAEMESLKREIKMLKEQLSASTVTKGRNDNCN